MTRTLRASWNHLSDFLLAVCGAQSSKQEEMTFQVTDVDPEMRKDVHDAIIYFGGITNLRLIWNPMLSEEKWSNTWTLKTNQFSILHKDQQCQILATLKCWRFGGNPCLTSLPRELLMDIIMLIARPPFVPLKRCYCCDLLVSDEFPCNWCSDV